MSRKIAGLRESMSCYSVTPPEGEGVEIYVTIKSLATRRCSFKERQSQEKFEHLSERYAKFIATRSGFALQFRIY